MTLARFRRRTPTVFSLDGRTMAVPVPADDADAEPIAARSFDVTSGQPAAQPLHGKDNFNALAFSPGGATLATADDEAVLKRWRVATGEQIGHEVRLRDEGDRPFNPKVLLLSPNGQTLFIGGDLDGSPEQGYPGEARLWDVIGWQARVGPLRQRNQLHAAAFSPDSAMNRSKPDEPDPTRGSFRLLRVLDDPRTGTPKWQERRDELQKLGGRRSCGTPGMT